MRTVVGDNGLRTTDDRLGALKPAGSLTQEDVDQLTKLVEAGKMGSGPWKTDDCRKTYETLKARGVDFVQPPTDRPYVIIEAVFKDNSGNTMVLAQDKSRQQV